MGVRTSRGLSRRELLRRGGALGAGLSLGGVLAACGSGSDGGIGETASAGGGLADFKAAKIDWRRYAGTTLVLGALQHPWVNALQPHLAQFTELTGITVRPEIQGEQQYTAKLPVTLAGGSPTPDVYMVFSYGQAVAERWLEPLDPLLGDAKLTDAAWYAEDDVFPSAREFTKWSDGTRYGLAITAEVQTNYYRSDLVPQPPATFEELAAAAARATRGRTAGIALRGQGTADAVAWPAAGWVFSYDGYLIDPDGKAALASPQTIAGVRDYAELLRRSGPKGVSTWSWLELTTALQQGQAAQMLDSSNAAADLLDPEKSRYAKQIRAARFPSHDGTSRPNIWHWVAGVNARSRHKEAAWLLLQWATSRPGSRLVAAGGGTPPRTSAWRDPAFRRAFGEQAAGEVLKGLQSAEADRMKAAWMHPKWPEVGDAFARAVNRAITGDDAASALREAQGKASRALAA
jgi:multiple sugar transport system substrate-binding protein